MHPNIIQAIAAEQSKNFREQVAAYRRTEQIRRSWPTGRPRPFLAPGASRIGPAAVGCVSGGAGQAGRSSSRKPTFTVTWK